MNKLTLKISPFNRQHVVVEIDGVRISPTKEQSGRNVYSYETELNEARVHIYTVPNELLVRHWFLRVLLYYFISLFGLFDWAYCANPYTIDYSAIYSVSGETVLEFSWDNTKKRVFKSKADRCDIVDNDTNVYTYDKRIKRRYIGMILFKAVSWLVIFITIILLVMR